MKIVEAKLQAERRLRIQVESEFRELKKKYDMLYHFSEKNTKCNYKD